MDDTDARTTGGKYRIIPIFEGAVRKAAATAGIKIMVGSGVDGSTYAHGTQALDLIALVKQTGFSPTRALQSATVINAEALGWLDRIGAIEPGKLADIIAVSGDPLADIARCNASASSCRAAASSATTSQDSGRRVRSDQFAASQRPVEDLPLDFAQPAESLCLDAAETDDRPLRRLPADRGRAASRTIPSKI
jgi:hypothetical protein